MALERLSEEQDIQYLIEMNRITRLLHKMNFAPRQRSVINFSRKYVITEKDVNMRKMTNEDK